MIEPTDSEQKERSVAVTLGEVLAGLQGMAEIPGMPELAEMPPAGFTFQIPPCQRPYCWKLSDIEHVLADVADMRSAESTTLWYFGPICFRRTVQTSDFQKNRPKGCEAPPKAPHGSATIVPLRSMPSCS